MALPNFPNSPTLGQQFTVSNATYECIAVATPTTKAVWKLVNQADKGLRSDLASGTSLINGVSSSKFMAIYDTVAQALADTGAKLGQHFVVKQYYADSNDDWMLFTWVAAGTGVVDGGSFINHGSLALQAKQIFRTDKISVWQFGASRTDATNNHTCLLNAITYGTSVNIRDISLGVGVFKTSQRLTLPSTLSSFAIVGANENSPHQQGSTLGATTWEWVGANAGGVERVIQCDSPWVQFRGFGVKNSGGARDFCWFTGNSIGVIVTDFSAILGTGTNQFTRAVFHTSADLGYAIFRGIRVQGIAPRVISVAQGGATGMTPIIIEGRSFFETTGGAGPMTVVYVENTEIDAVIIRDSTFNQPADELCIVDTTVSAAANAIFNLTLDSIEWDKESAVGAITDKALKLKNVKNVSIKDLSGNCSSVTNFGSLENSHIRSLSGVYLRSCPTPFSLDATSSIRVGRNGVDTSNVGVMSSGGIAQRHTQTFAANTYIEPSLFGADEVPTFRINVNSNTAWNLLTRVNSSGYVLDGQTIKINLRNTSAGAVTAPTLGSQFKLVSAITMPAAGKQITLMFSWDSSISAWVEESRSGEVSNT